MDAVSLLQLGSALVLNIGFCWLVGSWFARCWMSSGGVERDDVETGLGKRDLQAAGLSIAASATALLAATAVMGGVGLRQACPMFWMMVSSTDYGHAACAAILALAIFFAIRLRGGGRASDIAALLTLAAFALTRASMGHAGEDGFWTLALAAEATHFSAIGLWTGAVMVSGWFVLGEKGIGTLGTQATGRYLDRMSTAALLAVVAIIVTGIYSAWHRVGSAEHLVHTRYGLTLLVKIALVLLAIALGGYNKFIGLPAAARSARDLRTVRAVLQIETFLLFGAVLAAAALTSQQPPAAM
ncbi:MAG TPA: CopD family protein [Janthinobacterium sp.]|nr:CopD family protein [Janthinobacterium sp.]